MIYIQVLFFPFCHLFTCFIFPSFLFIITFAHYFLTPLYGLFYLLYYFVVVLQFSLDALGRRLVANIGYGSGDRLGTGVVCLHAYNYMSEKRKTMYIYQWGS